jgi:HSP20 family protein
MAKKTFISPDRKIGDDFSSGISTHVDWEPRTNIIEAGDDVLIEVELPGVDKEDISMVLENDNLLILRGIKRQPRLKETNPAKRCNYHLFEREFGSFYKRIMIDFPLDSSNIQSKMKNGVLTVTIPKKKTERISVEIK